MSLRKALDDVASAFADLGDAVRSNIPEWISHPPLFVAYIIIQTVGLGLIFLGSLMLVLIVIDVVKM